MAYKTTADFDFKDKRVLVRVDFNVPVKDARIVDDTRIRAALPGIKKLLDAGARLMLMSHFGRPEEGKPEKKFSLSPVAERLSELLDDKVSLVTDYLDRDPAPEAGHVVLLENVRFNRGEKADDEILARRYAKLCDIYLMDAFGSAHRAQVSTHGVARFAPEAGAGDLLRDELEALGRALKDPARPLLAIVGGSKVSDKLSVLNALIERCDALIVGGGIANTFLAASGHRVGKSLYEKGCVDEAKQLLEVARKQDVDLPLPVDAVVAEALAEDAEADVKAVGDVDDADLILDIGPETVAAYQPLIAKAETIVWNGPVGVFEIDQFAEGTRALAEAVAGSGAFSIIGGGDTIAALAKFDVTERVSYISTGGGAFLEFLEGKTLPAVAALEDRA
ncbi:MAG: phosphoglycerate kinase [Gammaproteobacteria bacterium]